MKLISRTDELILLAVCHLGDEAYGVSIRNYLRETANQKLSIGGVYVPLDRLVRQGFLNHRQGEPTPQRGGMSKRFYSITPAGLEALDEARRVHELLWAGVPSPSEGTS